MRHRDNFDIFPLGRFATDAVRPRSPVSRVRRDGAGAFAR